MNDNKQIVMAAVYRSSSCWEAEVCFVFDPIFYKICDINFDIIIIQDFNIDWTQNSFYKKLNDNGLKQI